jgi:hypothetical protein
MNEKTPLEQTISDLAAIPASATVDGTSTTERSASDLIALDQHLAGNQAMRKPGFGLVNRKIRRGGALG